jgi:hypothetical protein
MRCCVKEGFAKTAEWGEAGRSFTAVETLSSSLKLDFVLVRTSLQRELNGERLGEVLEQLRRCPMDLWSHIIFKNKMRYG